MTASVLDVYNNALSAVHAKGAVSSLNENSREREVCSRWYDLVRDTVQEAAFWPSCQATARLSIAKEREPSTAWVDGDPSPQFLYSYFLPENYLRARHLTGFQPFVIETDFVSGRRVLSTSVANATLVYSRRSDEVTAWTPGQQLATIYALAAHIAGPLTGNTQIKGTNIRLANEILLEARSNAQNSQDYQLDVMPLSLVARGAASFTSETRYLYPLGNLFAGANTDG